MGKQSLTRLSQKRTQIAKIFGTAAHAWFNLAAANGFSKGKESRDLIAKEMTSDQLAEAQRMARDMVESNPKVMGE
tara:strand:- start:5228 stop:5455 length:228 start_codon:yes stop_codon:yes gene_type:complete